MEQAIAVPFVVDGEGLWLSFEDRLDAAGETDWDRDAIVTHVSVHADVFHGEFTTVVWSHELVRLYHHLLDLWHRFGQPVQHEFTAHERSIHLLVALSHSGHLSLTIDVRSDPTTDTVLRFRLTPEYMSLAHWLQALYAVLTVFPPQVSASVLPVPPRVES